MKVVTGNKCLFPRVEATTVLLVIVVLIQEGGTVQCSGHTVQLARLPLIKVRQHLRHNFVSYVRAVDSILKL